jgi:hypothetical protein
VEYPLVPRALLFRCRYKIVLLFQFPANCHWTGMVVTVRYLLAIQSNRTVTIWMWVRSISVCLKTT